MQRTYGTDDIRTSIAGESVTVHADSSDEEDAVAKIEAYLAEEEQLSMQEHK